MQAPRRKHSRQPRTIGLEAPGMIGAKASIVSLIAALSEIGRGLQQRPRALRARAAALDPGPEMGRVAFGLEAVGEVPHARHCGSFSDAPFRVKLNRHP